MADPDAPPDWAALATELMSARQTVLPFRLGEPGPDAVQLQTILGAAASAPDHRSLLPWRFIAVPADRREDLSEVFVQALLERDPKASPHDIAKAREKGFRSPFLALLVVDATKGDADIGLAERLISAGCAAQNVLLMATAVGYGSALTAGKSVTSRVLHRFFDLRESEQAVCFLSIGTAISHGKASLRPRVSDYVSDLGERKAS
ncbi:nitroreductase family protein [Hydrogenophaga sp. RWCD_12]|uniref:nitroreductase family protein n=1 Tax=Hydrogenophaga sp. RWCD_12 TaxID=3391190 RepID=UPI0039850FC5